MDMPGYLSHHLIFSPFQELLAAINNKNTESIRLIIGLLEGSVNSVVPNDADGHFFLHKVAKLGDKDILKLFVQAQYVNVNVQDNHGLTALHYVLERQNLEEAKMLIEAGADPFVNNRDGKSPLQVLIEKQVDSEIIKSFENMKNHKGENSLFAAFMVGNIESMSSLIDYGCDVNSISTDGSTLLHTAAEKNHVEVAEMLLKNGADVNLQNNVGNTPLHILVCFTKENKTIQLFLNYGADVNIKNSYDEIPLFNAIRCGNADILEFLIKNGSDVNSISEFKLTPLHSATKISETMSYNNNNAVIMSLLLKNGANVNAQNYEGKTPLHSLLEEKDVKMELVKLLLSYKPKVNIEDNNGMYPLFHAISRKNVQLVQLLLYHGSDVNCANKFNQTPLHCAAHLYQHSSELLRCLLKNCADANAVDSDGRTPLLILLQKPWHSCDFDKTLQLMFKYSDIYKTDLRRLSSIPIEEKWTVVLKHIAKLRALELPINPGFENCIFNRSDYRDYFAKCLEELKLAKSTKLKDCWVTFFNIFTDNRRQLKNFAGNFDLIEDFEKSDCIKKFPIYGSKMQENLEKGIKKRKLFDEAAGMLSNNWPIFSPTHLIIRDILDCCLSTKDLRKF